MIAEEMSDLRARIIGGFDPLVGLSLSIARDAAATKNFQFGPVRAHPTGKGTVGEFALHVSCPWRLIGPEGLITGSSDRYEPIVAGGELQEDDRCNGSLQSYRLLSLLGAVDEKTRSLINESALLKVEAIDADSYGSVQIVFSRSYSLQIFPDRSRDESWRLFRPGSRKHLIFEGGKLIE